MARNAFLDGLAAYDVAFKREEQAGRNFFADAMDANKTNNTLMNDAVTRAFNQQTIDQRGQQFPFALAGLSRADEIARLMQPANAALTGVTSNYLVDQAGNGAYGAQIANRFNLQGVLGATNLTNAQTAAQNAKFTNAYVNKDSAALGALMGIPAADITFDPATGVATQVSTGKALHPQGFNVAMSQRAAQSAFEQAQAVERANAIKAILNPGTASTLPTVPTMSMANKFNVATPTVAADAVPNTPDIKDAAGMPSMINQTNADMLQMFNRNVAPFTPTTAAATAPDAATTPAIAAIDAKLAEFAQAGLNTAGLQQERADAVQAAMRGQPTAAQRVTMDKQQAAADAAKFDGNARNVAIRVAASPVGHVALSFAELSALQSFLRSDPTNAARFGLTQAKVDEAIKFNTYLANKQ